MKRQLLLTLIAISWVSTLYSQQTTFSKVLINADCDNFFSRIYSVVASLDSSYILVGYHANQGIILKVDSNGDVIWEKQIGDPKINHYPFIQLKGITRTYDSCYIVSGNTCTENCGSTNALCIKIDPNGDIIWSKTYAYSQASEFTSVQQTRDSAYIMIGSINYEKKILVSKIDSAGILEWTNILESGNHTNSAYSLKEYVDGSFIVTGYAENGPPFTFHPYIIKLSPHGKLVWAKQYLSDSNNFCTINDMEFTSDGFLIHSYNSNNTVILATDTAGNMLWNKLYDIPTNYLIGGSIPKIHKIKDNAFVFINQSDSWLSHVTKIDSVGDIIWNKELTIDPVDVIETSSEEFFIAGNRLDIAFPSQVRMKTCLAEIGFIQIDSMGNGKDCIDETSINTSDSPITTDTIIFSSISGGVMNAVSLEMYSELNYYTEEGCAFHASGGSIESNRENWINVFPNPSNGIFNLILDDNTQGQLIIFNSIGESIYEATIYLQSTEIEIQNQPDGLYFINIFFANNKYIYGKFVIRK